MNVLCKLVYPLCSISSLSYASAHMHVHCVLFHAFRTAISLSTLHVLVPTCVYMYFRLLIESGDWNLWLLVNFSSDNELVPLIGFDVL